MDDPQNLIDALLQRIAALEQAVATLQDENRLLREQLEQQQRTNARQAAPFRRRESKKVPEGEKKRPGRKPGHPGECRAVPEHVDQEIEQPLCGCPNCGGPVSDCRAVEQFIEEIPPVHPRVVRLVTWEGHCPKCGDVHSTHPLQTSRGRGAAKVQLGPRALAIATALNKHFGLSMRKTCQVLGKLFALKLSPGGLSQAMDRVADRLADKYEALQEDIRGAPATFADEPRWWAGEPGWWLWTFTTANETLFHVDKSRGSAVVRKILGDDYQGVLVSDCLSTYDPPDCRKHKCIAHHLQAIAKAKELPGHADSDYLRQWILLFKIVIILHRLAAEGKLDAASLAERRTHLESWIDRLLDESVAGEGEVRIRNRLSKQRPHLIGCLYDLAAEPTNNRAERSLRPAVIARKISCGNKTDRGRLTWQILASLAATCAQRGHDLIDYLAARLPLPAK
jgi:transposase